MTATKGLAVLLLGILLAGCTDNPGAIDQEGHNGFDRMTCTDFASLAKDVKYHAVDFTQAKGEADRVAANSQHGGDPDVRKAGSTLVKAYRTDNTQAITAALAQFQKACQW